MYDVFKRELKPFDLVLAEGETMRTTTISLSNFNLVVAQDKLFTGNNVRTCNDVVYYIENPTQQEIQIKNKLLKDWDVYVRQEAERKREARRKAAELRKELNMKEPQVGDILSGGSYGMKALYLGKCSVVYEPLDKTATGHCYYAFSCKQSILAEMYSKYKDNAAPLIEVLAEYITSASPSYMKDTLRGAKVDPSIKLYEPSVRNIMVTKSLSTRWSETSGHIDLCLPSDGELKLYSRSYERWNSTYGYVTIKFLQ